MGEDLLVVPEVPEVPEGGPPCPGLGIGAQPQGNVLELHGSPGHLYQSSVRVPRSVSSRTRALKAARVFAASYLRR